MGVRVGLLTIGQAPRQDGLGREIANLLGSGVEITERGALDELVPNALLDLATSQGDRPLITRLRDGSSTMVSEAGVMPLLQSQLDRLERDDGVTATLLLCSRAFPPFKHQRLLLQPHEALRSAVWHMANGQHLATVVPVADQLEGLRREWATAGVTDVDFFVANPYGPDAIGQVAVTAQKARKAGARLLFLNCFGFDMAMRETARTNLGGPVVTARSLAARLLAELVL
jgi:protein AroM